MDELIAIRDRLIEDRARTRALLETLKDVLHELQAGQAEMARELTRLIEVKETASCAAL